MEPFEELYRSHFQNVYHYVLSLCQDEQLAEEITQETFFKALKNIRQFDGRCQIKTWLFQIARNCYLSHCRKQKHLSSGEAPPDLADPSDLEGQLADRDTALALHRQLHRLPEPYKEVFSLRVFGELSFAQIGDLFEKSESWARVTYYRAKQKLKEAFKE